MELSKIVEIYRNIERKINISWTDTQKVMFVYQELCNCMEYSKNVINNRDVARNLMGLLYGKAVCSGFAMIFKEALDRLGITNIYQNRESSHSWNIAYVDGAYRAFELTWDCSNKSNRGCEFYYFNRDDHFYENKHHNIEFESEEKQYPITRYSDEEIRYNYQVINQPRVIRYPIIDNKPINITIKKQSYSFILDNGKLRVLGNNTKEFTRDDGTNFVLINGGAYKNLNKYFYVEVKDNIVRMARIYSESRLDKQDDSYDYIIANGLLSQERLATKINQFNGYVGYIGNNQMIYYDEDFEKSELNIIR